MAIRVDLDKFVVKATRDPAVFRISGDVTDSTGTITSETPFYQFSVLYNTNMPTAALVSRINAQIAEQKATSAETTLKNKFVTAYPSNIFSMSTMRS